MMEEKNITLHNEVRLVPILNIRMMTDDEWNRLAYKNYLERQRESRVRA